MGIAFSLLTNTSAEAATQIYNHTAHGTDSTGHTAAVNETTTYTLVVSNQTNSSIKCAYPIQTNFSVSGNSTKVPAIKTALDNQTASPGNNVSTWDIHDADNNVGGAVSSSTNGSVTIPVSNPNACPSPRTPVVGGSSPSYVRQVVGDYAESVVSWFTWVSLVMYSALHGGPSLTKPSRQAALSCIGAVIGRAIGDAIRTKKAPTGEVIAGYVSTCTRSGAFAYAMGKFYSYIDGSAFRNAVANQLEQFIVPGTAEDANMAYLNGIVAHAATALRTEFNAQNNDEF